MGMVLLRDLRQATIPFLGLFGLNCLAYALAVWWLIRRAECKLCFPLLIGWAVLFRVALLFATPPTLSDDVYRYIWDGRLVNSGVNPYAHAVVSPLLDPYDSPQRALVNNDWMASPYLPVAQMLFALVYRLVPDSPLAFQVTAALFDLLAGWMVADLLHRLGLPKVRALIYLWNPLVVVEFAHGAHVDSLMIFLIVASFWVLVAFRARLLSVFFLAAATLTKGVPLVLLPVVVRRWGWRRTILLGGLVVAACFPFALGAGWGLVGPLNGEGLFGALRIYGARWNYNGGIYHWLEVVLSGYPTPGAVPPEVVGWQPILTSKLIVGAVQMLILIAVWIKARRCIDDLTLIRLALVPLGSYLLLTTTVHPWYATIVVPFLPFLLPDEGERAVAARFLLPWLVFTAVVALSYLTYLNATDFREYDWVRLVEYVPTYFLLAGAAWPSSEDAGTPGAS
jgi:hypothetical protein